jgi:hypothetical protein
MYKEVIRFTIQNMRDRSSIIASILESSDETRIVHPSIILMVTALHEEKA